MDDTQGRAAGRYLHRLGIRFHDTLAAACDVARCVGWMPVRVSDAIGQEAARAITEAIRAVRDAAVVEGHGDPSLTAIASVMAGWHHSGGVNPGTVGGTPSVPSGGLMSLV